jgi:hypothetical protein
MPPDEKLECRLITRGDEAVEQFAIANDLRKGGLALPSQKIVQDSAEPLRHAEHLLTTEECRGRAV